MQERSGEREMKKESALPARSSLILRSGLFRAVTARQGRASITVRVFPWPVVAQLYTTDKLQQPSTHRIVAVSLSLSLFILFSCQKHSFYPPPLHGCRYQPSLNLKQLFNMQHYGDSLKYLFIMLTQSLLSITF